MVAYANPLTAKLLEARAKAAQIRREAFVDYSPVICGMVLKPITLNSYNALLAFGNAFAAPGVPVSFEDIAGFIWIHHADFGQFSHKARRRVFRKVAANLIPAWHKTNDLLVTMGAIYPKRIEGVNPIRFAFWLLGKLVPRVTRETSKVRFDRAGHEIQRLIAEAVAEFPRGDDACEPMPCSHQAHILNTMRRGLGMSYSETRELPLKQLAQFLREAVHHASNGSAMQLTESEADVWAEDLKRKTDAASTPEAMAAEQEKIKAIVKKQIELDRI